MITIDQEIALRRLKSAHRWAATTTIGIDDTNALDGMAKTLKEAWSVCYRLNLSVTQCQKWLSGK